MDTHEDTHEFTLIVAGIDEDKLDEIYEATDGEATVEFGSPSSDRVAFDLEAASFSDAVLTAITQIETVPGLQVLRVEPDEFVWAADIASRTGRSRQNIDQLIKGERGPGTFPAPLIGNRRNPLWRWLEVQKWFAEYEHFPINEELSSAVGAINGALESRNNLRHSADTQLASRLTEMVAEQTGGRQEMNKKQLAMIAGVCTIIGAATEASRKRRWEDAHKAAAVLGGVMAILGALG